jgi:NAD(P)-dependent dehydrogenase (short-subunit alcohol dehydrogenase family)
MEAANDSQTTDFQTTDAQATPSAPDLLRLDGKVAFVTGSSKGIGKAMAHGLAEQGARVVISSRKQDAVEAVAAELEADGLEATGIACHVGKPDAIEAALEKTEDVYGGLDVLVNNAAVNPVYGGIEETEEGAFDKIMQVNVKGPLLMAQHAHAMMKARGGGSIINVSSISGLKPDDGLGAYSVSKAALIQLSKVLAKEWGDDGIRANTICPGIIKTKFSAALWQNDALMKRVEQMIPAGRIGQPHEMTGLAVFLASDASSFCTGSTFVADGGQMIAG